MKNLYTVIEENPNLTKEIKFSEGDIAAANYIYAMSTLVNHEISMENDGAWVHTNSDYNEVVAKIIESNPNAVNLILSLRSSNGVSYIGGIDSQFAYLLVTDYLKENFSSKSNGHTR
mgnify:CR=1 FL=1